jgi:hypothetical protein
MLILMRSVNRIPSRKPLLFVILLLMLVAISVRSISFQWSPLPYNIDGLSEARVADAISSTGHFTFKENASYAQGYVSDMPVLGLVIAFVTSALGTKAIDSAQLMTSVIGSAATLLLYVIFIRYWRSSTRSSISSVLVLALTGSFVFSAGCVWKETLGILLILLALNSFPQRQQLPHRFVLTASVLLLPFTHHHATVVGFIILTFLFVLELSKAPKKYLSSDPGLTDILTIVSAWLLAIYYYNIIKLPYLDYLSPKSDLYLYLAVAFLMLVVCIRLSRTNGSRTRLPIELAVPAVGVVIMVYNFYHPLFVGTSAPAAAIAVPFLAYLILVVPAWQGAQLALARIGEGKNMVLALMFGPLSLITFAFLRGLDATSYTVIYRTFDFILPAFAIFIGLGFAALVKGRERLGIAAGFSLIVVLASTLPVAYDSQELFGVENQTYWYEYDAFDWLSEHGVSSVKSDQRLSETGNRLFDIGGAQGLPFDLREGIALDKGRFYVLEDSWSTKGAQQFPLGVIVLDQKVIDEATSSANVFFEGGSPGDHIIVFQTM